MLKKNYWFTNILIHLALVVLASVLFALSFPNLIFKHGLPVLAWFAYIPVIVVIRRSNLIASVGWGAVYGLAAYSLFNYWLGAFHPLAGLIVYSIYLVFLAATFFFLKLADIFYGKRAYLVQWLIWLAFEYLSTTGFLGYSYGVTGYSQWKFIPLIQIASVTGVWGVSALTAFPSFWLAAAINSYSSREAAKSINIMSVIKSGDKIPLIIWAALLVASLVFGFINMKDYSSYPETRIALIQHNTDPWEASKASTDWGIHEAYRKDLEKLTRLSDEAIASYPETRLVVWPETAFIPRIHWHTTYREDQNYWRLVRELLEYLSSKDIPFLIGNDDARRDPVLNPNQRENHIIDYNAAMYFERGVNTQIYRKLHLVPFTEHFPYQKQFPRVHQMLLDADTHFWEKGTEATVFNGPGFNFSAPICFEDTFGYISREFVLAGADVIVNISNDAWSESLPAQNQHLAMAVFRAVENYRPMVRSTASGQTAAIDPNGRVTAESEPFKENYLSARVPLVTDQFTAFELKKITIYTAYGDYLALFFVIASVTLLISGVVLYIIRKQKTKY
ncbi:MAG: apolipoprotein N-acyltransferase [Treponema sp.]|nr:apolipoprotein N-acyltransferase [Treponema sp.]